MDWKINKGNHIKVSRIGYHHHGIYTGDNKVIHFTGEPGSKSNAEIKETSLDEFLLGGFPEIVQYGKCHPVGTTVTIARYYLGEKKYHLLFNNCEHFARFCKTEKKISEEAIRSIAATSASVGTGATISASVTVISAAGSAIGLSGPGIMSGLAAIGPGGVIGGIATLAAAPAVLSNMAVSKTLRDDDKLPQDERKLRKVSRASAKIGTFAGAAGTVGALSAVGTTTGLSGPGIASGLAAIGGAVGGGMVAGVAVSIAAPAAVAAIAGFGLYKLGKIYKKKKGL